MFENDFNVHDSMPPAICKPIYIIFNTFSVLSLWNCEGFFNFVDSPLLNSFRHFKWKDF